MSDNICVRRATTKDIREDVASGDTWVIRRLQVDRRVAVEAATDLWGPAGTSALPGEMIWRLRVNEIIPMYLAVCPGEEEPIVMFNLHRRPERGVEEAILDRLGEMLARDDDGEG